VKRVLTTLITITLLAPIGAQALTHEQRTECRFRGVHKREPWEDYAIKRTARCGARAFGGSPSLDVRVLACEGGWEPEPSRTSIYHGPAQYLRSTYEAERASMPAIRRRWDLSRSVHSPRSNILLFTAWMAKRSTAPWACA
jgi:hypothetical protein